MTLSLMLGTGSAAFAQAAPAKEPAPATNAAAADKGTTPTGAAGEKAYPSIMRNSSGRIDSYLVKDAPLPSDFVMGKQTAPLVIIEYASLSCPHCAHFSNAVLPELEKKYINTGRVRYIMRPFPLNEPALKGAMLIDCVGEKDQAKYYLFAHVLFDAQSKWAMNNDWQSGLETIATVGGLSQEQFHACIDNTERETKVLKQKKLATDELHVPHTPYIIIGGEAYNGDVSLEALSKFIDSKLETMKR